MRRPIATIYSASRQEGRSCSGEAGVRSSVKMSSSSSLAALVLRAWVGSIEWSCRWVALHCRQRMIIAGTPSYCQACVSWTCLVRVHRHPSYAQLIIVSPPSKTHTSPTHFLPRLFSLSSFFLTCFGIFVCRFSLFSSLTAALCAFFSSLSTNRLPRGRCASSSL